MNNDVIEGLEGLEDAIKELGAATSQKAIKNALMYSSKPMLDRMKATTPYDESDENQDRKHLVDAVKRKSEKSNGDHAALVKVGVISKSLSYIAYMLNYGTKYIAPNNWLNKAAEKSVDITIERFVKKLRKNFEKAKR
ncbi:MAG: HK97-gp10 family putative phage morphogenesis protein [Bermanella sp.]